MNQPNQITQGTRANQTGKTLELFVENLFREKGFSVLQYKDWKKGELFQTENLLLKNVPYTSIYEHKGKTEFLLLSYPYNLEIRIECKWQQQNGSVDEKLPYLFLNCLIFPEPEIIILIDGPGFKRGAIQWLKNQAKQCTIKIIRVMNVQELMIWTNNIAIGQFKEDVQDRNRLQGWMSLSL